MKKFLLLISLSIFSLITDGQSLQTLLTNSNGMSKSLIFLEKEQQVIFQTSNRNQIVGLKAPADLRILKVFKDRLGYQHYKYQQTWKGIPIEAAVFSFHTLNNRLTTLSGKIILDISKIPSASEIPTIPRSAAILAAKKEANGTLYAWQVEEMENRIKEQTGNPSATFKPNAKLVWYCPADELNPSDLQLAYKVAVYSLKPLRNADYFIDAATGKLLGIEDKINYSDAVGNAQTAYSGVQSIHSDFTGSQYRLRDYTKGDGIITLHGESGMRGNDYFSNAADWSFNNSDQAALDAHYGLSQTWLFYKNVFNRDSYDDKGTAIYSYVNDPTYLDNAFWDGTAINFNKRSNGEPGGVTAIDVAGHELTHGVTQETSGLKYVKEPGGINESLSDIMGKAIQFYAKPDDVNWVISNDMDWEIRNMANPNEFKQPDTYKGTYWKDKADVHTLSGVGNFMFYLLSEGGTGINDRGYSYDVNKIGVESARAIIYRSNLLYLTPTSVYLDWRKACEQAAIDLFGKNKEYRQVKNAWDAVGVDSISNEICWNPVSVLANEISPRKALIGWQNYKPGALSYNLIWRVSGNNKWDTVYNIMDTTYWMKNLQPATFYQVAVASVCGGNVVSDYFPKNGYSFVTTTKGNYCFPNWGGANFYYITSVSLNGKTNTSENDSDYGDFTNVKIPLQKNQTYSLEIEQETSFSQTNVTISAYLDYNRDRDLSDPGELIGSVETTSGENVTIPFTVPSTSSTGPSRLRIILEETWFKTNDPCYLGGNGEAEDYTPILYESNIANSEGSDEELKVTNLSEIQIIPNPVVNTASLRYQLNSSGKVEILITDYLGKNKMQINKGILQKGNYRTEISTTNLSSGTYQIQVLKDGQVAGRIKMVVIK